MGTLTLPASGPVCVDTQAVIYSVEKHPTFGPLMRPLWQAVQAGAIQVVGSELLLLETLVGPLKTGDVALAATYEQFFQLPGIRLSLVSASVLRAAAQLRATVPKLRTPDAIHAATARAESCTLFVTNDHAFRAVPGLPTLILQDLLATP